MTVGFFIGIRASYIEEARDTADAFVAAANRALRSAGLPEYVDPEAPPDVYNGPRFGRSGLDHHFARCIAAMGELARSKGIGGHLELLATNPYRVAFLPQEFSRPLETDHVERLFGHPTAIAVGSSPGLLRDVLCLAPYLGIIINNGVLDDELASRIDNALPLSVDDDGGLAEDERTAWLLLHEGARLSVEHGVALSLAG